MSARRTTRGHEPVLNCTCAEKLAEDITPVTDMFLKTETVDENSFATTISSLPSPSKSPISTDRDSDSPGKALEPSPVKKSTLAAKLEDEIGPGVVVFFKIEIVFDK